MTFAVWRVSGVSKASGVQGSGVEAIELLDLAKGRAQARRYTALLGRWPGYDGLRRRQVNTHDETVAPVGRSAALQIANPGHLDLQTGKIAFEARLRAESQFEITRLAAELLLGLSSKATPESWPSERIYTHRFCVRSTLCSRHCEGRHVNHVAARDLAVGYCHRFRQPQHVCYDWGGCNCHHGCCCRLYSRCNGLCIFLLAV